MKYKGKCKIVKPKYVIYPNLTGVEPRLNLPGVGGGQFEGQPIEAKEFNLHMYLSCCNRCTFMSH